MIFKIKFLRTLLLSELLYIFVIGLKQLIGGHIMNTAILSDGTSYYIPNSDLSFFKELALRMKWQVVDKKKPTVTTATASKSWVDEFAGKWQDQRTTAQIVEDIHKARTNNSEIVL